MCTEVCTAARQYYEGDILSAKSVHQSGRAVKGATTERREIFDSEQQVNRDGADGSAIQ